jgi:hypothetical protein
MLRRIFGNVIPTIDGLIERIPPHIRDIIQKASLAFAALLALIVIVAGVNRGLQQAKPAGYKLVERNRDLFYLQEMREEYAKKRKLVEDVELDPLQFPSRQKSADDTQFAAMGRDTMGHLMGEKDEMLKHEDVMRPKEKSPGYLGDSYQIPRLTPDKKAIEDDDGHLTKEKIGKPQPVLSAPSEKLKSPETVPAAKTADVFDEHPVKNPKTTGSTERSSVRVVRPKGKLEFVE